VVLTTGLAIEAQDYNTLALEINRLYSDNNPALSHYTSNLALDVTSATELAGKSYTLAIQIVPSDYVVVTMNEVTVFQSIDFTLSINPTGNDTVTFINPIASGTVIKVYVRTTNRYGWGQTASVYPIAAGSPVLADESTLQAYLEANTNNIIDKLNVMETRVGGPNTITRIASGDLITPSEFNLVQTLINTDILSGANYWNNDLPIILDSVLTYDRTATWTNLLTATTRYTFTSYAQLRHFFNSGCTCRSTLSMTGDPANPGFYNWNQVLTAMGTLIFDYDAAYQTGINGISGNIGVYDLTPSYQTIFTSASPNQPINEDAEYSQYTSFGEYSFNNLVVEWRARLIENVNGTVYVDISAVLNDTNFPQDVQATTTCTSGYSSTDEVVESSAVYSALDKIPSLSVLNDFIET
jgi:hypothetical protein